jgi:phenylacetate-CoA ligase
MPQFLTTPSTIPSRRLSLLLMQPAIGLARVAKAGSRSSLRRYRFAARHGARGMTGISAAAAALTALRTMREVPAYAEFVAAHGGVTVMGDAAGWLARLPTTDKHSYIDQYPLAARCRGGVVPLFGAELDESAGSSGTPYTWIRGTDELHEVHLSMAMLARHLLDDEASTGRPLVTLNGFSMGAWATGTNVTAALKRLGVVKSTGPDTEKMLTAMRLIGPDRVYVIAGYPPFLRRLLDAAKAADLDLAPYTMYGVVGGEGMSEALRNRLERSFRRIYSAYGASDLDIGVAAETPVSIEVRRLAAAHPALALELFGTTTRLPMVFQYDPSDYYVETVAGELVVTVNRPSLVSPRIRYNVHDAGGTLPYDAVMAACARRGLDPVAAGLRRHPHAPFELPFLYVHGRADSTISFMGANLYPEDVEQAIGECADADVLGAFALSLVSLDETPASEGEVRPCVHIEVVGAGRIDDPDLHDRLVCAVRERLLANSADYRSAVSEDPAAADLRVVLHLEGCGPFAGNAARIKRRYIV